MPSFEFIKRPVADAYVTFVYLVLILLSLLAGVAFTHWLSGLHTIPTAKILNLAGISYGLIGVLVLSEAIVRSEQIKQFMVAWVGTALLWTHTGIAWGAIIGAVIASISGRPSGNAAYHFAFALFAYVMLIGGLVDGTATNPLTPRLRDMPARHQRLGLIILVTGMALQLTAAIRDF
jgi:hypothetical protein